jgi:hypothetical protein
MHGTEHRITKTRTLSPLDSTATVFAGYRFVAVRRAACIFIMGPFARAGVFLARSGFRLREFRSGVKGPHLTLRSLTNRLILLVRPFSSASQILIHLLHWLTIFILAVEVSSMKREKELTVP